MGRTQGFDACSFRRWCDDFASLDFYHQPISGRKPAMTAREVANAAAARREAAPPICLRGVI